MPTDRISISLAIWAIIGAAPVPVPPPIPAVIKTILVRVAIRVLRSSKLSSAAKAPTLGLAPAPNPSVSDAPNWILIGTELSLSACASVLVTTKKDYVRIPKSYRSLVSTLHGEIKFEDENLLKEILSNVLENKLNDLAIWNS